MSEIARRFSESEDVLNALCALIFVSYTVCAYYLLNCYCQQCQALLKLNTDHLELQIQVATATANQTYNHYVDLCSAVSYEFPDLLALSKLALTVASAPAERSFSAMRRIKENKNVSKSIHVRKQNKRSDCFIC